MTAIPTQALLGGTVHRTVLPSGLRVLTEHVPGVRSAAVGVWVGTGSRDEVGAEAGASHYLEHLLFKGTERRSALEISASIEAVGGDLNAFTSREYTCYYARVLDEDLPLALDVVSDMVFSSLLRDEDLDAERGVVLEEIAMHDDDPGDIVHDVFAGAVLGDRPLGRPVLGTVGSIEAMTLDLVTDYYGRRYVPTTTVIAVSGSLEHAAVLAAVEDAVERAFGRAAGGPGAPHPIRPSAGHGWDTGRVQVVHRSTEQAHLVLGVPGVGRTDERRWALGLLSTALGEGMSSRLFQEIRERRGLAYSVYSFTSQYADAGLFGIYAGCAPRRAPEVLRLCRQQLEQLCAAGLDATELARAKGQTKGALVLGLEDTGSRMSQLGKSELTHGRLLSVDDALARIDAVTADDVRQVATDVLALPLGRGGLSLGAVGPVDAGELQAVLA